MEKIPTADEFFDGSNIRVSYQTEYQYCQKTVAEKAIEFAKLHVEAALKKAYKNAKVQSTGHPQYNKVVTRYSILNSYPLENIK
jgi:hypothetical protein